MRPTWKLAVTLLLGACSQLEVPADAGSGGGTGGTSGAGGGTSRPDACVPLTCAAAGLTCGTGLDGCGGVLECGRCSCTPSTFAEDCPTRACEVATGCTDNRCRYEPLTCDFQRCDGCAGDGGACSDTELRACGSGCAAAFCDPSPSTTGGRLVYANRCVARADVRCGVCGLGTLACAPNDAGVTCHGVELPGVNPQYLECNGGSPAATVLYVDPTFSGATRTGAKSAPFVSLGEALSAAAVRTSRAIIVGGTPTLPGPLLLSNGVSVLGGFSGFPDWVRDEAKRPVIHVPLSAATNGQLIGVVAKDIVTPTELSNLDVETESFTAPSDAGVGINNVGAQVTRAGSLTLRAVRFRVGDAQPGRPGAPGAATSGTVPLSGAGQPAAMASARCTASGLQPSRGGTARVPLCPMPDPAGLGGNGATVELARHSMDTHFTKGVSAPTGADGGLASSSGTTWIPGPGEDALPWPTAAAGASVSAEVLWSQGLPAPQGRGGLGSNGLVGRGGGGGGGGRTTETITQTCIVGGGGGAGGAGGCGGKGGTGGWSGGWAIGLAVSSSPGLRLEDVELSIGLGGSGGPGGDGSAGLPGAMGGAGGTQSFGLPLYTGSPGGRGADGQRGGNGGSGATGLTRGVLCETTNPLTSVNVTATGAAMSGFLPVDGCN